MWNEEQLGTAYRAFNNAVDPDRARDTMKIGFTNVLLIGKKNLSIFENRKKAVTLENAR